MRDLLENLILDLEGFIRGWWDNMKAWGFGEWCIVLILTFFVYVMIYGKSNYRSYGTDMQECISDGHKGYECRGILKGGHGGR